ncbi:MAG: class I SAM-dependent methyltransferase [Xenococcaceae cyanobacterium]
MQLSNKDLTQKILKIFEEKSIAEENIHTSIKRVLKNDTIIKRHIDAFNIYKDYLQDKTRFLDWGCKHGLDAYLIRNYLGDRVEIHGCDIKTEEKCGILYDSAKLKYSQLTHQYQLPYEDSYFDTVISSGVLEHVPNDYESLKELHRIIQKNGYLIITFLPNYLSYTEFFARTFRNGEGAHRRLYSLNKIKKSLLHTGFLPIYYGYHQVLPSLTSFSADANFEKSKALKSLVSKIYNLNNYAEKIWPINKFAANIFVIAQKKMMM